MTILSEPLRTLRVMDVNPWQRLAEEWPTIQVIYRRLPTPHDWGQARWKNGRPVGIVLHEDLTQVQRRCALAHELEHFAQGSPCGTIRPAAEKRVIRATALYLLPDIDLIAAALADCTVHQAAEDLWVTWSVLVERLRAMSDAELDYIADRRQQSA